MSIPQRPRILLLIPHLGGGGAEQVIATLVGYLDRRKYEVHLGLATLEPDLNVRQPADVAVHRLEAARVRNGVWPLIRLVWRLRPAVILSGISHLNLLVLLLQPFFPAGTRVLVRQSGSPSTMLAAARHPSFFRILYRIAYRRADGIICQTNSMAEDLRSELRAPLPMTLILPNPVNIARIRATAQNSGNHWNGPGPNLLAIGRLVPEKGLDLLISAFACVHRSFPHAELVIAGRGEREASLKLLSKKLAIEDHVRFIGYLVSPAAWFNGASLFVLSSREEALPNALLEAAAAGLPIAALPASRGVRDLLHGKPGVWLGDELSAKELERMLSQALLSIKPGQRFPHPWIEAFDHRAAINAYENLIDSALQERKHAPRCIPYPDH